MRIDYKRHDAVYRPLSGLSQAVRQGPLDRRLIELVEVRASQLNGCAHCLEMHTKIARSLGESDDRLHLVAAWRDAPLFDERERAALRWCEELTLLSERDVPDELYEAVRACFSEEELVHLTLAIVTINAWNRFAVGFRAPVGDYRVEPAGAGHHG